MPFCSRNRSTPAPSAAAVPRASHTVTAARLPFSARHARVASAATANVFSVFPLSLTLQPHVLQHRHLLVRCLQECGKQAPAHSAERFVRLLRHDGETAPAAAARRLPCSCLRCGMPRLRVTRVAVQIAAYCVCAVAGGRMLYRWRQMGEEGRRRVWPLYGWFCGLMVCGSCVGCVSWAVKMMYLEDLFKGSDAASRDDRVGQYFWFARSYSWGPPFLVSYALEFLFLSAAKLMVLDRMAEYAAGQDEGAKKRWAAAARAVMAVVLLGNSVGVAANIAAAPHAQRAAEASSTASELYAANKPQDGRETYDIALREAALYGIISSVQSWSEVAVLLLIVVAFVVAGVFCARRLRAISSHAIRRGMDAGLAAEVVGKRQIVQIAVTAGFVFVAFVVRSVFSTMRAVAFQLRDISSNCGPLKRCDASCYNVFTLIQRWMNSTPEFQLTIVLISSPLALLVALWGVTSTFTLLLMKSRRQEMGATRQDLMRYAMK